MKEYSKQWLGILLGFVLAMIGFFLLEPINFRYVLGIFITIAGIVILALCSYHLELAKRTDRLRRRKL